jgi:hypothetical protein
MQLFRFRIQRRRLLGLPLTSILAYSILGVLGLSARAQDAPRIWRINASSFSKGIDQFYQLVMSSARDGGNFPVSALMWYFPLNPTTPDGFQTLVARGDVVFGAKTAVNAQEYASLDFLDAALGRITTVIPDKLSANYKTDPGAVTFEFDGTLAQVIVFNIPIELGMPKSLRVKSITFKSNEIDIQLSNVGSSKLLEIQLVVDPPQKVVRLAAADSLSAVQAMLLLSQNTTVCCQGNCARDDGAIGGETELSKRWSIIKKMVGQDAGTCYLRETDKNSPPLGMDYSEVAGGFLTSDAASEAMRTTYKDKCKA